MNPLAHILLEALVELGILKAGEAFKGSGPGDSKQDSSEKLAEISKGVATKRDVADTRTQLAREIANRAGETKAEIQGVASGLEAGIAQCRSDIGLARSDTENRLARLESEVAGILRIARHVLWVAAAILGIAVIGLAVQLSR